MTYFHQISFSHQAVLLTSLFLTDLLSFLCIGLSRNGKRKPKKTVIDILLFLVLFAFVGLCTKMVGNAELVLSPKNLLPIPVWILWCIDICAAVWLICEAVDRFHYLKYTIGRHSVKEAMDTLPGAVCFFNPNGTVKLCNLQMYRLCRSIMQSDLQTLSELSGALEELDGLSGIIRLPQAYQTYLFPDGKVWRYHQNEVTAKNGVTYTEAMFYDVTELYEKHLKLKKRNAALKEIYREIGRLSDNVLEMTRESEILSAKTNLHDQMGAGITAIRRSLLQQYTSEKNAQAIELLTKAVKIIKNDNESPVGRTDVEEFIHNAGAVGIQVEMTGSLPEEENIRRLFLLTMKECCTNAARHAGAHKIWVSSAEKESRLYLHIENDGEPPKGEVTPRGGLLNLKRYFDEYGGEMTISSSPGFSLTASVPANIRHEVIF
ncbi:MAG: hypothetical protein PUB94_07030 [Oscillospiraceae bacterium]|nr:hypothetical protein [Oscillospiraceae bacterium]